MKFLSVILLVLLLSDSFFPAQAKNNSYTKYLGLGDSILTEFDIEQFDGESTNWYVQQIENGVIFLSNKNGLYSFDGGHWRRYNSQASPLEDIRQFVIRPDGRIYVAAKSEFGYFETHGNGDLEYHSLVKLLEQSDRVISDVNNVYWLDGQVIFVSPEQIMAYSPGVQLKVWKPVQKFSRAWLAGDKMFFNDGQKLRYLKKNVLHSTPFDGHRKIRSFGFVEQVSQGYLVGTFSQGIYLLQNERVSTWLSGEQPVAKLGLYNSVKINKNLFAVGSINGGVIFFNHQGDVIYRLNTDNGLSTNITLNLFLDRQSGLWLAQQGQLVRAQLPFELSVFSSKRYTLANVRGFSKVGQELYLSAINGVKRLDSIGRISNYPQALTSTADIVNVDGKLLVAGANQCQIIDPESSQKRALLKTAACRDLLVSRKHPDTVFMLTEKAILVSVKQHNSWQPPIELLQAQQINSELVEDPLGQIWTADTHGNLFQFRFNGSWQGNIIKNGDFENVPLSSKEHLYVANDQGFYDWDIQANQLGGRVEWFYQFFGDEADAPYLLYQDNSQRLWIATSERAGYFRLKDQQPFEWVNYPIAVSGMNRLRRVFEDGDIIWLGFDNGVVRFVERPEKMGFKPKAIISEIRANRSGMGWSFEKGSKVSRNLRMPVEKAPVRIFFGLTSFQQNRKNKYRYRINESHWTSWNKENYADLGSLSGGEYSIELQARDVMGNVYTATTKQLSLIPPWYSNRWAYAIYLLILLIGVSLLAILLARIRTKKLVLQKQQLERQVRERTKTIQVQAELLTKQAEARTRFFANVSHEFRTPLTLAIGPLNELIKDRIKQTPELLPDNITSYLTIARDNCHRMLALVGQILDINRLDAGEMTLIVDSFPIGNAVSKILDSFQWLAKQRNISLTGKNLELKEVIYFDTEHFNRVMDNLLSNAIKFSSSKSKIEVGIKDLSNSEYVQLWVCDQGPGIAEEERSHLFERYFQGKASSELQPGTGIGLSMIKELLLLHCGNITLDLNYKEGAKFDVRIKRGMKHFQPEQLAKRFEKPASAFGQVEHLDRADIDSKIQSEELPKVLIVDDNPELRYYIRSSIGTNYQIAEAHDGKQALDCIDEELPDFIISDIMMPRMNGLELVKYLKSDDSLAHIPVLLLTAKATKRDTVKGLQQGADDYLSKPFDSSELIARIDSHLAQKQNVARQFYQNYLAKRQTERRMPFEGSNKRFENLFVNMIDQHLADPEIDVAFMAHFLNMERSSLFRRVKSIFQVSPNQYLRQRRLHLALQMLRQESGSVSEIAYAVGFQSLSYFSRSFAIRYKFPPTQYRKISDSL